MSHSRRTTSFLFFLAASLVPAWAQSSPPAVESQPAVPESQAGERLPASAFGPTWIEDMDAVVAREAARTEPYPEDPKGRNGAQGQWEIPSMRWSSFPHSGQHYAAAKWGDTRMGIGFGRAVDLDGVWVAGHMDVKAWTPGLRAVGYRGGSEVAATAWFRDIDATPSWFAIDLDGIDRVVLEAEPVFEGAGFYGIDDLSYTAAGIAAVVDFEEPGYRAVLTGSAYAGLDWETGTGDFAQESVRVMPPPQVPPGGPPPPDPDVEAEGQGVEQAGAAATLPGFVRRFPGPKQSDPGGGWMPPDTCGAIGTSQFVAAVNQNLGVYDRLTEERLTNVSLQSFFNTGASAGDPRVAFDHHHGRWIVIATDFNTKIFFAYSLTEDATGAWFKTNVILSQGSNANDWPDYPTLGVDAERHLHGGLHGRVGRHEHLRHRQGAAPAADTGPRNRDGLAAAPLGGRDPPGGDLRQSRWRSSSSRGSTPTRSASAASTRRCANPTMTEVGFVDTISGNSPPSAPALGSNFNLDTLDGRPMNAVYRNGAIWTAHCVNKSGRAAINWYKIQAATAVLLDQGTVLDPVMSFFMPSISVNANDDVLLGFTASSPSMWAGGWYTGRLGSDPAGEMAVPAEYKNGTAAYNQSSSGVNRWGDYSVTSTDPLDDLGLWTIQEYAQANGNWITSIGEFTFGPTCGIAINYCTPGVSASGCQASLSSLGTPSASAPSGFSITAATVEGTKDGLFFYGTNGAQANPWGNGTSFQCVVPPTFRSPTLDSGGTIGACDGSMSRDMNAYWAAFPPKNPGAGAVVRAQLWYRDPANTSNQTTSLSDALQFAVCP